MRRNLPSISLETGLAAYIRQINSYPLLEPETEYMLAKRVTEYQDIDAAHQLVTSHLRLVVKIAMDMRGYGIAIMDLISEGSMGLMHAVKKFNPDLGHRLSTYAMWWIRAAMQEFIIKAKSLVKMGTTVAQKKLFFSLNKAKNKIQGFDQSTPGLSNDHADSIANQLQVSKEDVVSMNKRMSLGDVSLDEVIDEDRSLLDTLSSEETLHDEVLSEAEDLDRKKHLLHESLKRLSPREQDVIMGRHMQETSVTLEDLSQKYNVSRERIRQIEARAMEKIQEYCSASLLPA